MKTKWILCAAPITLLCATPACFFPGDTGGSGGSGSGASASTSSENTTGSGTASSMTTASTSSSMGTSGWTAMPLLDDMSDPNDTVFRKGNDLVTGIHYTSLDSGVITTTGSEQTGGNGGAIYKASQKQVESLLFGGNRDGLCLIGTIDFTGLEKTSDGYIAMSYACDVIASHDGGASFDIGPSALGEYFGIESVLAMHQVGGKTIGAFGTGYISSTDGSPGPQAIWDDLWAPQALPPVPNPVPVDQCEEGPSGTVPAQRGRVFVSADGSTLAYTARQGGEATICVSHDGGTSFFPKVPAGISENALSFSPSGVVFTTNQNGIAFWANSIYPGEGYIAHTTNGGDSFELVAMPAQIANTTVEFESAFFAPDGQHGWIVGYDHDHSIPLLIRTSDAGATWEMTGGDLAQKVIEAGGDELFTGFALDATHIWVGGNWGILMANENGGD